MSELDNFYAQFSLAQDYYLKQLDFLNWYRYYFIIREVIDVRPKHILEIGAGSGIVKNCLQPIVEQYIVMDINPKLNPDIYSDIRERKKGFREKV
jgi:2-polyprenyl-3-methyl-5-hydroxy-6-metoxy-1,4-benzoquinol methylase